MATTDIENNLEYFEQWEEFRQEQLEQEMENWSEEQWEKYHQELDMIKAQALKAMQERKEKEEKERKIYEDWRAIPIIPDKTSWEKIQKPQVMDDEEFPALGAEKRKERKERKVIERSSQIKDSKSSKKVKNVVKFFQPLELPTRPMSPEERKAKEEKQAEERRKVFQMMGDKKKMAAKLTKTKMCKFGKKCRRRVCNFAHTLEELQPAKCLFGTKCRFIHSKTKKCCFLHPGENREDFLGRTGLKKK